MNLNEAMNICHKNKVFIYPRLEFINSGVFYACVYISNEPDSNNKNINNHNKIDKRILVSPSKKDNKGFQELNEALSKTYIFYANKILSTND